jgi:hypothetical protein
MIGIVTYNVATNLYRFIEKSHTAIDIIQQGVKLLEDYDNVKPQEKKKLLKTILISLSKGKDAIVGTADDNVSPATLQALLLLVDSGMLDFVIDGVVKNIHTYKRTYKICGICLKIK